MNQRNIGQNMQFAVRHQWRIDQPIFWGLPRENGATFPLVSLLKKNPGHKIKISHLRISINFHSSIELW